MCIHSLMQLTVSHCDVNREEKCSDPVFMTGELDDCRTIVKVYWSSLIFLFRWFFSLHRKINIFSRERIKEEEKKRKWCSDVEKQWRGSLSVSSLWPLAAVVRSKFLDRCRCVVASCQTHLVCVSPPPSPDVIVGGASQISPVNRNLNRRVECPLTVWVRWALQLPLVFILNL